MTPQSSLILTSGWRWSRRTFSSDLSTVTQGVATLLKDPTKGIYLVAETPEAGLVGR